MVNSGVRRDQQGPRQQSARGQALGDVRMRRGGMGECLLGGGPKLVEERNI